MNEFQVDAQLRTETGKGAMRRMRRAGEVPAVIYGAGKDPQNIRLKFNEISRRLENEAFYSHILTVNVEGKKAQAVLKALQRDPASARVTHADFLRVKSSEHMTMRVPLHFANEEDCVGQRAGGIISHLETDVEISCLPKDLPEYIVADLLEIDIGETIHLSDLKLPEGVVLTANLDEPDNDSSLISIQMAAQELDVEETAEDVGEEAVGDATENDSEDDS